MFILTRSQYKTVFYIICKPLITLMYEQPRKSMQNTPTGKIFRYIIIIKSRSIKW